MNNNTAEKFLVLIQHPEKHRFIVPEQRKNAGLIGSILLDLANSNNIDIENGKIVIKSKSTDLSQTHIMILEEIGKSSKTRKIKTWIAKFSRKSRKIQKELLLGLESKGIIKIIHKSFLGIKYYKTQLTNSAVRESLINEIRDIIFRDATISKENALILGIIEACKMHKIICKDKNEIRICKKKLVEIMKSDSISQGVDKVIKEMQAVIIGAIIASTAAVTVSSG